MAQKKSKLAKFFIYLVLFFIVFSFWAIYIVMYAWINEVSKKECPEWYVLNTETWKCEEDTLIINEKNIDAVLDNEESCTEAGWMWYEENQICILSEVKLDNEESCTESGWTWYEENQVCILPDA